MATIEIDDVYDALQLSEKERSSAMKRELVVSLYARDGMSVGKARALAALSRYTSWATDMSTPEAGSTDYVGPCQRATTPVAPSTVAYTMTSSPAGSTAVSRVVPTSMGAWLPSEPTRSANSPGASCGCAISVSASVSATTSIVSEPNSPPSGES
ncbi:hypothetical protein Hrd1104_04145 [Halorhabdus sp. CBA1104]|nr:hypothetical protein Hrd1104_04145 [Halorhabdus sp. CBA1104]